MSLRNQPYFPLYVQDFLTDEKLIECSAESTGVYIRLMCILHKSDDYGCILLKQKDKQNESNIKNFALKLAKQMPYDVLTIEKSLKELIDEKVLILEDNLLYQKRMRNDGILSDKRAKAGSRGGKSKKNDTNFATAKIQANVQAKVKATSEYENEYEYEYENNNKKEKKDKSVREEKKDYSYEINQIVDHLNQVAGTNYRTSTSTTRTKIIARLNEGYKLDDFIAVIDKKCGEWKNTEFEKFLRPETLFGNKFENYLNQAEKKGITFGNPFMEILKEEYEKNG